jgi:type III secretory pathway component EscS
MEGEPMSKLFFEILKLSAIVVGTVSGLIGTITQTKNKRSDRLTRWGQIIVALLVVSGVLSATIQSVEDYQSIKKDKEEAASRSVEENRTKAILLEAEQLKQGIDSQGKALDTTVSGIDLTARNMNEVFTAQTNALLDMYSLTHPLGSLRVALNVSYPIAEGVGQLDATWLQRVHASTGKNWAVINDASDPLNPKPASRIHPSQTT